MRPTFCVTPKSIFLLMVIAICIDCAILLWRSENSSSQALSSSDTDAHFKIRAHPKKIHTYMNNKEEILNEKAMEFCKETKLTLCKPTPRRSDSDRAADSHRRSPFKIASLRKDPFLSVVTSFRDWQYDNCKFCETARKDIGDVDGVYVYVLSMRDEKVPVPRDRRSDQTYFMVTWEAPIHTAADSLKCKFPFQLFTFWRTLIWGIVLSVSSAHGHCSPFFVSISRCQSFPLSLSLSLSISLSLPLSLMASYTFHSLSL